LSRSILEDQRKECRDRGRNPLAWEPYRAIDVWLGGMCGGPWSSTSTFQTLRLSSFSRRWLPAPSPSLLPPLSIMLSLSTKSRQSLLQSRRAFSETFESIDKKIKLVAGESSCSPPPFVCLISLLSSY
jgi:hypothetical protein